MNSDEIYIDGKRLTLAEETQIALTYQANNVGEMRSRQASLTNTHKVPAIAENATILESAEQPASETNVPYRKLPYRLVRNGADVRGFENAYAIVENSQDARFYNITAYGGNADFFALIEGKSIRDLDLSDLDHVYDRATVSSLSSTGYGIIYPIIEWSDTDSNGSYSLPTGSRTVDVRNMFFCIYFCTLIDRIFSQAGWTHEGDIFSDQRYRVMLINAVDKKLGDTSKLLASAKQHSAQTVIENATYTTTGVNIAKCWAKLDEDLYDPLNCFTQDSAGHWSYQAQMTSSYDFTVYANWKIRCGSTHKFEIYHTNSSGTILSTLYSETNAVDFGQAIPLTGISMNQHDRIEIYIEAISAIASSFPTASVWLYQCELFCTNITATIVPLGATYPVAANLPDIKQTDMLGCMMKQFGLFPVTDSVEKRVRFVRFDNVRENITQARDWSKIIDASSIKLSYRLPGYAQQNWMRYKHDDTVGNDPGDGALTTGDETLEQKKDQFVLPFAASNDTTKLIGLPVMRISKYGDGGGSLKCEPRVFQLYIYDSLSPGITYTDGFGSNVVNLSIGFAYFSRPTLPNNLDFQGALIPTYYSAWRDLIYKPKIITVLAWLTEAHIQEFEHDIPVFIDVANDMISITGNFYVNVISNYIPGKPTMVELIRL